MSSGATGRSGSNIPSPEELDVAAHGDEADPVVGLPFLEPEEPLAVAEGEDLDPDADELGHEEVAEFVDEDEDAEDDDEGERWCRGSLTMALTFA